MPNRSFPGNLSIRKPTPKIINYSYDSPDNVGYTCAPETFLQKGCEAHPPFTTSGMALEARPTRISDWGQGARSTFQLRLTATHSYGNVSAAMPVKTQHGAFSAGARGHGGRWCLDIVSLPGDALQRLRVSRGGASTCAPSRYTCAAFYNPRQMPDVNGSDYVPQHGARRWCQYTVGR